MAVFNSTLSIGLGIPEFGLVQSAGDLSIGLGIPKNCISICIAQYQFSIGDFANYYSSFARFFGVNAMQTSTHLTIRKSDLPRLSSLANNTAESLLIALLLQVLIYESNNLISNVYIELYKKELINVNGVNYSSYVLLVRLLALLKFNHREEELSTESNSNNPVGIGDFN